MPKAAETHAGSAVTLHSMNNNPDDGGVSWCQSNLVQIEGASATAKFGGGGMADVPTVIGTAVIPSGGTVAWHVKVDRKYRAGAPMRVGVQRTGVRCGMNWNDRKLKDHAWYLDSSGDMCNGPDTVFESGIQWGDGDVVGVRMDYGTLTFTVNGKLISGKVERVDGEVQCAAQLFSKGDKISMVDQYVPDADDIDDTLGANSDPFANHKPNIAIPQKPQAPQGPAGTPDDPYRFNGARANRPPAKPAESSAAHGTPTSLVTQFEAAEASPAVQKQPLAASADILLGGGPDYVDDLQELDSMEIDLQMPAHQATPIAVLPPASPAVTESAAVVPPPETRTPPTQLPVPAATPVLSPPPHPPSQPTSPDQVQIISAADKTPTQPLPPQQDQHDQQQQMKEQHSQSVQTTPPAAPSTMKEQTPPPDTRGISSAPPPASSSQSAPATGKKCGCC